MPEGAGNIAWPSGTRNAQKKTPRKHEYNTKLDKCKRKSKAEKHAGIKGAETSPREAVRATDSDRWRRRLDDLSEGGLLLLIMCGRELRPSSTVAAKLAGIGPAVGPICLATRHIIRTILR